MTTVTVTAEHILAGLPGSCGHCPIALAVREVFPGTSVEVADFYIQMNPDGGELRRVRTPHEVTQFIRDFDNRGPVEPFSFNLDYPAEVTA